jgi:uncharacterized caspase-like protein
MIERLKRQITIFWTRRCFLVRFVMACLTVLALLSANSHATAQTRDGSAQRLALVIGNDNYTRLSKLENARADARAMAETLRQAGFEVTLQLDVTQRNLLAAVRNFKAQISGGNEAVFYFAGHGVQIGAANYLIPVDMVTESAEQVRDDALPLQRVLDDFAEQKARFSLAIIDACRDNPFTPGPTRSLGATRGLAPTTPATGQMVLFSAGTGQTALDRLGSDDRDPNGLFTRVLLQEMRRPGVGVDRVLRNTRDVVVALAKKVNHQQVPALYDQAIGEFFFWPSTQATEALPAPVAIAAVDPSANDRAFWDSVKDSKNANELKAYLSRYPEGLFASLAQARLAALTLPVTKDASNVASAGRATVYFIRKPKFVASAADVLVSDKGRIIGKLTSGSYFVYDAPEGDLLVNFESTIGGGSVSRAFNVGAGRTYYIEAEQLFSGGVVVRTLDQGSGTAELRNLQQARGN